MTGIKNEWFGNAKKDILSAIVVAVALIPEAIGFSIIAGVDPMVGLYASFCIAIVTAFFGGRPGMISAATGAMALVLAGLVRSHGVEYMLVATILAGALQVVFGFLKIGALLRFIPKPVMIGFVNALGIMIFRTQLSYFNGTDIMMYVFVVAGILIIYLFPKINKTVPAPLITILVLTGVSLLIRSNTITIGDMGNISGSLPKFLFPDVPLNLETLKIVFPVSLSLSIVGLVESLLTARLLDELTDTKSNKNRECIGQGVGNMVAGLFGGMAGCAMIGQSVINFKSGGRGRLSTLLSGLFLIILILALNRWVVLIPVAALISVMIVVSVATFDWSCIKRMKLVPKTDTAVMLTTVAVVLATDNLAYGVIVGIIMSSLFFVYKISKVKVKKQETESCITYKCFGQLFFASTTRFLEKFDYDVDNVNVIIDVSNMRIWDESAAEAFDKVLEKFNESKANLKIEGLSDACEDLLVKTSYQYSILPEYAD